MGDLATDVNQPRGVSVRVRFENGSYWATVDECPGLFAAGDDERDLSGSLVEGLAVYLAGQGYEPGLDLAEIAEDVLVAAVARQEMADTGEAPVPWEQIKVELGLS